MHPELTASGLVLAAALTLCTMSAEAASPAAALQPAEDEFHFVVLGDSQFHEPHLFNRMIDDVRLLQPAFVIQVGDMIEGYASRDSVAAEWVRFKAQIAPLAPVPFFPVPGNHDLYNAGRRSDPALEALYRDEWGDPYYTFRYRNAQFVVLNTDGPDAERRIDDGQLAWLKKTLSNSGAEHLFVFMHRPPRSLQGAEALHALLRRHPVRTVFYGHHHHYHFEERDGISYVMTNAAANGAFEEDAVGGFHHFLSVSVRDDSVRFAVIRADAIDAPHGVHPDDNYDLFELQRNLVPDVVVMTPRAETAWLLELPLRNPTDRDLTLYVSCASADNRWRFRPASIPAVSLDAGAERNLILEVGYDRRRPPESEPTCTIAMPFSTRQRGWFTHEMTVTGAR